MSISQEVCSTSPPELFLFSKNYLKKTYMNYKQFSGLLFQSSWMHFIWASDLEMPNLSTTAV